MQMLTIPISAEYSALAQQTVNQLAQEEIGRAHV